MNHDTRDETYCWDACMLFPAYQRAKASEHRCLIEHKGIRAHPRAYKKGLVSVRSRQHCTSAWQHSGKHTHLRDRRDHIPRVHQRRHRRPRCTRLLPEWRLPILLLLLLLLLLCVLLLCILLMAILLRRVLLRHPRLRREAHSARAGRPTVRRGARLTCVPGVARWGVGALALLLMCGWVLT